MLLMLYINILLNEANDGLFYGVTLCREEIDYRIWMCDHKLYDELPCL